MRFWFNVAELPQDKDYKLEVKNKEKTMKLETAMIAAVCAFAAVPSFAGLVAKWDFNNYDPANPTATNILEATVGGAGKPCYYAGANTALVTDGTLGQMYVVSPDYTGSDATATKAAAGLGEGNYAIAIPNSSHIALPIPDSVKNHVWTMKIRYYLPKGGIYHSFFNRSNSSDGDLFTNNKAATALGFSSSSGYSSANNNYTVSTTAGAWHTLTVSAGEQHFDVFYDETTEGPYKGSSALKSYFNASEALTSINGIGHLLLCADENGEDNLMYIDYVELYDEAGVFEGKLPHYTKAGLTGEWTFPAGNVTKATVGRDLEKFTRTGSAGFTEGTDGVLPGDGHVNVVANNGFKCYHNLTNNSSYTIVMDVRIPNNANKDYKFHGLLQGRVGKDGPVWISCDSSDGIYLRYAGKVTGGITGVKPDEWMRVVITYNKNANASVGFVNGVKYVTRTGPADYMAPLKGGCFVLLGDENGEDKDTDISYAAVYDRVLTDTEIAELHSRPLAQKADETFVPTVSPAGVWVSDGEGGLAASRGVPLASAANGGYTWTRASAPAAATYVADLTLPAVQTDGGVLVKNASGIASGIYGTGSKWNGSFTTTSNAVHFTTDTDVKAWGYYTLNTLDRTSPHRVAVTWAASGCVRYYVDGRSWGTIVPTRGVASAAPSAAMTFLEGLGATVTRLAAYDAPLTPDEIASLGGAGTVPAGNAPNAPTITATIADPPAKALVDTVSFTVKGTHPDGEYISFAIDFGDGTGDCTSELVPSGSSVTFSHMFTTVGSFTPRVKTISQNGVESAWTSLSSPIEVVSVSIAARDVLLTWPWQQNVYTNRFTIMCEGVKDAEDPTRWDGLELQYGANYENRVAMTRVESNGGTWIYKAQVVTNGAEGAEIPYRLGYYGLPLSFDVPADNTAGTVKLWTQDENESFSCSIWGDNQQGAKDKDWDSDKYAYVRALFTHMVAQGVDFGISSGDMASSANYSAQIVPGILQATDGILGRTRPYYVAWGNHDTSYPNNKSYFETGSIDEPGYGTSEGGNYYLYRGNVLFVFVDHNLMSQAATQTWLANLLATERAQNAKFRILVHHFPFWLECWGSHTSQPLLETAKAGGIDIVFSGHMHGYERIHKDGIVQVTNGGAGYLDHVTSVERNYGSATFLGGHRDVPYLWARQKSVTETNVLGPAEPVRMGCIQSYGELKVDGNVLTYRAHGFNADGSYIGVFDEFSITNTAFAASSPAVAPEPCADPSAFAAFTSTPVTNAAWKDYKDAIGETFTYAEGKGGDPVVNVSKTEIEKFLAWLNGASGTYRLPTVGELETAFAGNLRRNVAEWTSSVDPVSGWCRILGSPALAAEGTWTRAVDKPCIATAGCHANYLGFRLATGAAPAEPLDPASFDAALVALAGVAEPAEVYKWENGALVDVSSDWTAPSGDLAYSVPVIFTGSGNLAYDLGSYNVVLGSGFAAENTLSFTKGGSGSLTVGGEIKGGGVGWSLATGGALALDSVSYAGSDMSLRPGDRTLDLKGDNDFSWVNFSVDASQGCTNYVASVSPATFRARSISNKGATLFGIGTGVTVRLAKDLSSDSAFTFAVDGELDTEAFNMLANRDPWIIGSGTVRVGYFGTYNHSWIRLAVSNIVFTTANPLRSNHADLYQAIFVAGDEVHVSSTCDWSINATDNLRKPVYILADTERSSRPKLVIEGSHDVAISPTATVGSYDTTRSFTSPWNLEMAGTGTLTLHTPTKGDIAVTDGTVKISALPCAGATSTSGEGKWAIDETLSLSVGQKINGAFAPGGTLSYNFGANTSGEYTVLDGCGLSDGDITVTTSLDSSAEYAVQRDWSGGNLKLIVGLAGGRTAEWVGGGTAGDPFDASNWRVTDSSGAIVPNVVPNGSTLIRLSGATSLSFPATAGFAYGGLLLAEDVSLAADCDWSGLGAVAFRDYAFVDLRGHRLDVAGFSGVTAGKSGFTDSTTDARHPGELHLSVASGATQTNSKIALTGNLKFVKEDSGTFVSSIAQTYTGGTLAAGGTLKFGNNSGFGLGRTIEVASGATLDIAGVFSIYEYPYLLSGGTICNTGSDLGKGDSQIARMTLSADSTFNVASSLGFINRNYDAASLDLGGKTLTVSIGSGKTFWMYKLTVSNGMLDLARGGWAKVDKAACNARSADVRVNCALNMAYPLNVRNYEAVYGSDHNEGTGVVNVYGTFKPSSHNRFRGCVLQNGSTLDLLNRTSPLPLVSSFSSGEKTLAFANNATVNVTLKTSAFPGREAKIVSWSSSPSNIGTVTFKPATGRIEARDDGLYLIKSGIFFVVR